MVTEDAPLVKFLPCPFCGFDDEIYPTYAWPGNGPCLGVDCLRCGFDFTVREGMDVREAWNKRAPKAEGVQS